MFAPELYGKNEENLHKLVKGKILTDSKHHLNNTIRMAVAVKEIKKIISLDSLSDTINIYNFSCDLVGSIIPHKN